MVQVEVKQLILASFWWENVSKSKRKNLMTTGSGSSHVMSVDSNYTTRTGSVKWDREKKLINLSEFKEQKMLLVKN